MKKAIIILYLLVWGYGSLEGQWYVKKYNVTDINALSKEQIQESLKVTKSNIWVSTGVALLGGIMLGMEYLVPYDYESDENPTIIEQLLGEENTSNGIKIAGAGLIAGGLIGILVYFDRYSKIKSTFNMNFPSSGSLILSPALVMERSSQSVIPGFTLTFHF